MNDKLITIIAKDLNIRKGDRESAENWQKRVIYSFIGLNMLAATYDYDDDDICDNNFYQNTVSMQRVRNRGIELFNIIDKTEFNDDTADTIRESYVRTGYMLHKNNRLTYPPARHGKIGNVYLSRGQAPWTVSHMSGLGTFVINSSDNSLSEWYDLFCIEEVTIRRWYNQFEQTINWREVGQLPENVEFANISEKPTFGYWQSRPPKEGVTIYRDERDWERQYGLLKVTNKYEICPLPDWRVKNEEYLRITLRLRILSGNIPVLKIRCDNAIAELESDYLLPPSEQNVYELFSWPNPNYKNSRWQRVISIEVLPLIKELFARMGFALEEERW